MIRTIVAEDDPLACSILKRMLGPEFSVRTFGNGEDAWRHFMSHGADVVLTDLKMPRMHGLELLEKVKEANPETLVFVITGYSSVEDAVAAIKLGATDYIAKPFNPDDVMNRINRAIRERRMEEKLQVYEREKEAESGRAALIAQDPAMLGVLELARKAARTDSTILIQGETGTGKELIARMVHNWSARRDQPFVPVNCGALAEGVLESELFGHEKGAFTGALARRAGYIELANRGTLFLDEIGTTTHQFQVRLLRALQDRVVQRVGSSLPVPVDIRVVAATNLELENEARTERFRSDLYYRLSVLTVRIPPLRQRPGDIPLLAEHFVSKYRHINPLVAGISAAGAQHLASYEFPGNVRELENIIERGMILETGTLLTPASLLLGGPTPAGSAGKHAGSLRMDDAERDHIIRVLKSCAGRKIEAARILGINKTTLWRKLKSYDIE